MSKTKPQLKKTIKNAHPRRLVRLAAIENALARMGKDAGIIDIVFVDDKSIKAIAGKYRGSPHPTDVLAFGYYEKDLTGEVIISLDRAGIQANARGVPLYHELLLLCVHGILHICGKDDENYADYCEMKKSEFETMVEIL